MSISESDDARMKELELLVEQAADQEDYDAAAYYESERLKLEYKLREQK